MSEVKKMNEGFDFANVDAPKGGGYLQPGHYYLTITKSEFIKPTGTKPDGSAKTPYLEVTFEGATGSMIEKFFVTPKSIDRLQYLHLSWFDKKLDKLFDSAEGVGAYFAKVLTMKPIKKAVCVGGKQGTDGKIYAGLGYSNFVLPDDMNIEEGPFDPNSLNYKNNVKMMPANASMTTNNVMLPSNSVPDNDPLNDLPF